VNLDAPQYSSPQNRTRFRIETQPADDTRHVDPSGIDAFGSELPEPVAAVSIAPAAAPADSGPAARPATGLVRALIALAFVEALVIAGLLFSGSSLFDTRDGRLVIESDPPGAEVWLDGQYLGTTPLSVMSSAGERSLRIGALGTSRTMKVDVASGQVTHARVNFVRISDPPIPAAPIPSVVPPAPPASAPHMPATGKESARLRPASIEPLTSVFPTLPRGRLAIRAEPWAEVWLDGRHLGETPLVEVAADLGLHEVVLRHPDLGERRTQVRVAADAPAQITVDLRE
jgi:hypothetical protein